MEMAFLIISKCVTIWLLTIFRVSLTSSNGFLRPIGRLTLRLFVGVVISPRLNLDFGMLKLGFMFALAVIFLAKSARKWLL